jgi:hypothetical protein
MTTSDYLNFLRADLLREGLSEDQLKIVDSILDFCRSIGHPEWESSHDRIAKCLYLTSPPIILLRRNIDLRLHVEGLLPLIAREFPTADIALLNDPLIFTRHLLHHEIAHIVRRDLHLNMTTGDVERDCDEWAFERIKRPNQAVEPTAPSGRG